MSEMRESRKRKIKISLVVTIPRNNRQMFTCYPIYFIFWLVAGTLSGGAGWWRQ
jgi:hypothetical protein